MGKTKERVRERPLILSGPMVRAVLEGRKTQTRRVVKPQPVWGVDPLPFTNAPGWWGAEGEDSRKCPHGVPGDRLWVRETWADAMSDDGPVICYRANLGRRYLHFDAWPIEYDRYPGCKFANWASDLERGVEGWWRSPIHMPRWASRLSLEITGVRVERLQEISNRDCLVEGIEPLGPEHHPKVLRDDFARLWDSLHGAGAWDRNDWVWVISFRRLSP